LTYSESGGETCSATLSFCAYAPPGGRIWTGFEPVGVALTLTSALCNASINAVRAKLAGLRICQMLRIGLLSAAISPVTRTTSGLVASMIDAQGRGLLFGGYRGDLRFNSKRSSVRPPIHRRRSPGCGGRRRDVDDVFIHPDRSNHAVRPAVVRCKEPIIDDDVPAHFSNAGGAHASRQFV
jgi:hypothetical protein